MTGIAKNSVLTNKASLAREKLWVSAEELAELFDSEDVHVQEFVIREASTFFLIWHLFVIYIWFDDIAPNLTASDSWTGGAVLLRVPGSAGSVVVFLLIHVHCLAKDARITN